MSKPVASPVPVARSHTSALVPPPHTSGFPSNLTRFTHRCPHISLQFTSKQLTNLPPKIQSNNWGTVLQNQLLVHSNSSQIPKPHDSLVQLHVSWAHDRHAAVALVGSPRLLPSPIHLSAWRHEKPGTTVVDDELHGLRSTSRCTPAKCCWTWLKLLHRLWHLVASYSGILWLFLSLFLRVVKLNSLIWLDVWHVNTSISWEVFRRFTRLDWPLGRNVKGLQSKWWAGSVCPCDILDHWILSPVFTILTSIGIKMLNSAIKNILYKIYSFAILPNLVNSLDSAAPCLQLRMVAVAPMGMTPGGASNLG